MYCRFVTKITLLYFRSDIMVQYEMEKKKAIEYMAGIQPRVAITSDLWTSDNQKRGYMAITAHFIDESWTLRNIIMRYDIVFVLLIDLISAVHLDNVLNI